MALTIIDNKALTTSLREERRRQIKTKSKAANTLKMLETNIRRFQAWCESNQLVTLPASPETVTDYLIHLADSGKKISTLQSATWAIGKAHSQVGHSNPCETVEVKDHLAGIKRLLAEAKSNQARVEKNKGTQGKGRPRLGGSTVEPPNETPTLTSLGINKAQSSRWQKVALIPDEEFEEEISRVKGEGAVLTSASMLNVADGKPHVSRNDYGSPNMYPF